MYIYDFELKVGNKIEIEIPGASDKKTVLKSQVLDVTDDMNYLIAVPIHNGHYYNLHDNSIYKIYFTCEDKGLLYFNGMIIGHGNINKIPCFFLRRVDSIKRHQRRSHYRLKCVHDVYYRIKSSEPVVNFSESVYKKALSKNISGSGACILADEELKIGKIIELNITIDGESLSIDAIVTRCNPKTYGIYDKYDVGLAYQNLSEKNRYKIIKYIFEQQRIQINREKNIK